MAIHKYPLLLKSLFFIIHFFLLQTCAGKKTPESDCPPSSCGGINNPSIRYPFRLRNDPQYCGEPDLELFCENNTTLLYLDDYIPYSHQKYVVRAIDYDNNLTTRLTDASILQNNTCSLPNNSTPLDIYGKYGDYNRNSIIYLMSCPLFLANNSSSLLKTAAGDCGFNESDKNHTHILFDFGSDRSWDIMDNCSIELVWMTSLLPPALVETGDQRNSSSNTAVSISQTHTSLLHGFQLPLIDVLCPLKCRAERYGFRRCFFDGKKVVCEYDHIQVCYVGTIWRFPCDGLAAWFANASEYITLKLQHGLEYVFGIRSIIGMGCMLWLFIYKFRRRHLSTFDVIEGFLQTNHNLMPIRYSYRDIKKMTRGFKEKLGQGGYGCVYKGKLRSGHAVAVKLLNKPKENEQDFINEIATIGRIHHVNVVKLVGFCAGRFNKKRALIFDFMPNGSLEKHIFSQQNLNPLSWEKKYEIAVGVARGIEYLHRGCDIQILHFDIKPHNILLDDKFTPKISDFGLAKLYATDNNTVTLTAARGTIGYVAPELINRSLGGVSYKADVYSFGMMLIEMVGLNKHITANDEESSQYFPDWIYKGFNKGEDIGTGDVHIIEDNNNENDGDAKRITRKMTIVGLWCIQMSPADRPSMSEVVKMLESQNANIQIPPQPSNPTQTAKNSDQAWGTESSSSTVVMGDYACSDLSKGGSCI